MAEYEYVDDAKRSHASLRRGQHSTLFGWCSSLLEVNNLRVFGVSVCWDCCSGTMIAKQRPFASRV